MSSLRDRLTDGITHERLTLEARRARVPLLIYAALAAVGLTALVIVMNNIAAPLPWQETRHYRIALDDATGVQPNLQEVRISGLRVGRIVASELVDGHAELGLELELEHGRLYRDARVRLRPQTALQDMYVEIEQRGRPAAGELSDDDVLPARRTETPVDMGAVLDTFDADARARMQTTLDELGKGLRGRGDQLAEGFAALAPFLRAARRLTREMAQRGQVTRRLVHNMRLLTDALGQRDRRLARLVDGAGATLPELAAHAQPLDRTLVALAPTLERLQTSFSSLRGALGALDPTLAALRPTADALPRGLTALRSLARTANPALASLRRPVRELRPLASSLEPTARALDRAFPTLLAQVPRVNRVTAQVVPCEFAVQKFFAWTSSVFKFADANGAFPRGDATTGTEVAGGVLATPNLRMHRSCADEEPMP